VAAAEGRGDEPCTKFDVGATKAGTEKLTAAAGTVTNCCTGLWFGTSASGSEVLGMVGTDQRWPRPSSVSGLVKDGGCNT